MKGREAISGRNAGCTRQHLNPGIGTQEFLGLELGLEPRSSDSQEQRACGAGSDGEKMLKAVPLAPIPGLPRLQDREVSSQQELPPIRTPELPGQELWQEGVTAGGMGTEMLADGAFPHPRPGSWAIC